VFHISPNIHFELAVQLLLDKQEVYKKSGFLDKNPKRALSLDFDIFMAITHLAIIAILAIMAIMACHIMAIYMAKLYVY
jgi:hypothetical protein